MKLHNRQFTLFPLMLVLYEMATYFSNDMYLPALPQMMRDLHLNLSQAQMTLTIWFAGAGAMPLFMGMISDRLGRRAILLGGGYIYVLATLLCALTNHYGVMLAGRFIEGSMLASMSVAGYACIHESYEKIEAIKILALMGSISILAPALGPLVGGLILLVAGWRFIFLFIAVWALISVVFLTLWMPETLAVEKRSKLDPVQLAKQYWGVLSNKQFTFMALIVGLIFAGFIMWITAGPLLLIETFHYSPIEFGLIQALVFAAYMGSNYLAKRLIENVGVSRLVWLGLVITLAGSLFMLLIGFVQHSLIIFILGMTIYSFGSGLSFAPLSRCIIESSTAPMGTRVALSNVLMTGFGALGSVVVAFKFNGTVPSLAYPVAVTGVAAMLLSLLVLRRQL